jgi:hypothetical protein
MKEALVLVHPHYRLFLAAAIAHPSGRLLEAAVII